MTQEHAAGIAEALAAPVRMAQHSIGGLASAHGTLEGAGNQAGRHRRAATQPIQPAQRVNAYKATVKSTIEPDKVPID